MNELKVFTHENFGEVRVIEKDGEPWFIASDVAKALGYEKPNNAVNEHCKKVNKFSYPNSGQPYNIIPQGDVLRLIVRSNLPQAQKIEEWIFDVVVPSVLKHGAYMTPLTLEKSIADPSYAIGLLTALKQEQEARRLAEQRNSALTQRVIEDEPKVAFAEAIQVSDSLILVGVMAKLIRQSTGIEIGQNRMFEWLRNNGFLHKGGHQYNLPTQRAIEAGWLKIKEGTRTGRNGESIITKTPMVTGKGQVYLMGLIMAAGGKVVAGRTEMRNRLIWK
jgi:anti-repressor protein